MRKLFSIILALLLAGCGQERESFSIEVLNGYTPVKQQAGSQLCWAYAMLAAIETEHIMRGDSVELSVAWVERMVERDPKAPRSKRAMGITAVNLIQRYGLVPRFSMPAADAILPRWVFLLGMRYTPQEFAHSVCAPGEYIGLGSSEGHAYHEMFVPDLPDNWERNQLLNLPADSLLAVTERAVRLRHGVCWEGDTSERGFDWKRGVARLGLLHGGTTDDHCMAIVGLARDGEGRPFFIMKNSWGTANAYGGLLYMSFEYFKKKSIAVFMTRDAFLGRSQQ